MKNETQITESRQGSQESKQASQTEEEAPTMTWSRMWTVALSVL